MKSCADIGRRQRKTGGARIGTTRCVQPCGIQRSRLTVPMVSRSAATQTCFQHKNRSRRSAEVAISSKCYKTNHHCEYSESRTRTAGLGKSQFRILLLQDTSNPADLNPTLPQNVHAKNYTPFIPQTERRRATLTSSVKQRPEFLRGAERAIANLGGHPKYT